jgi:hypothetical protein
MTTCHYTLWKPRCCLGRYAACSAREDAPRLSPIRSLAYFRPIIDELRAHPAPGGYLAYLRLKLRQAATALPATVQKICQRSLRSRSLAILRDLTTAKV